MSIKGLLKNRWEGEREGREGPRSKNLAGKEPSRLSPPGETHCLQNKQCNEKDKGGLRSGRRHEMTHKHTEAHPSPSRSPPTSPSLTSSAPSCESPPPYLRSGLRRAARGSCSSSGACRTARNYLSRAQTACPRSSRICTGEETTKTEINHQAELDVSTGDPPREAWESAVSTCEAYVAAEIQFSSQ